MTKQTKDGWIRHRGGKCPVDAGTMVDIRYRGGVEHFKTTAIESADCEDENWIHEADKTSHLAAGDIMAYRVCEPVIEPVSVDQIEVGIEAADAGKLAPIEDVKAAYAGPLQWRDRLREIDDDIKLEEERHSVFMSLMERGRADLVAKLAAEGFALITAVVGPAEDMGNWLNWRAGDLLERISDAHPNVYTPGNIYAILHFDDRLPYVNDNYGPASYCQIMLHELEMFKFHSRPSA